MRNERSWACKSENGFQSGSKMTTTEAAVRFKPTPPARVEIKKIPRVVHVLNSSTSFWRWFGGVAPSRRSTSGEEPCCHKQASKMSKMRVLRENTRTFWPLRRQCLKRGNNTCIFPQASGEPNNIRFATCRCVQRLWSMPAKAMAHNSLMRFCWACSAASFGGCGSGFRSSMWFVIRCNKTMSEKPMHLGGLLPRQMQSSAAAHSSSKPFWSACRW
mmetsp:Transcript_16480/g.57636  ORF Transcript_16480/g.57636 Transcript_16480/m.57636 type:complete len:216 (-) Transcript_16480:1984-2631(-)